MTRTLATDDQKAAITATFQSQFGTSAADALGRMTYVDRVYELRCLVALVDGLRERRSSLKFTLSGGPGLTLRSKGGPIDRQTDAYVEVRDGPGPVLAEIWSNVEFWSLSHVYSDGPTPSGPTPSGPTYARAHELDLVLLKPKLGGRPKPAAILIGVEAKHRPYGKALLKELLGVRREMALRHAPAPNRWEWWSDGGLPVAPTSGLIAWCSEPSIQNYNQAADFYGILMEHLPL